MQTLIIYAHPYRKSFNHAELMHVIATLSAQNRPYQVLDLYADGFNPAYDAAELALFNAGKTHDDLVLKYQRALAEADHVIFIFPVWWNDAPAMVKGFIDKVMKKQFAYTVGKTGVLGKLTHIKQAIILTTATSPKWYLRLFCGNAIGGVFKTTLHQLGIKRVVWHHLGSVDRCSSPKRTHYLQKISHGI